MKQQNWIAATKSDRARGANDKGEIYDNFFGCKQELSEGGVTEDVAVKEANDKRRDWKKWWIFINCVPNT